MPEPYQAPWRGANMPSPGLPVAGRQGGGWTPTAANLLVLIGLEIVVYVALRYTFRIVHGG